MSFQDGKCKILLLESSQYNDFDKECCYRKRDDDF